MKNPKLGSFILILIVLLVLMGLAFIAGAASAQDPARQDDGSNLLAQLRLTRNDNLVTRAIGMIENFYYTEIDAEAKEQLMYGAVEGVFSVLHGEPYNDIYSHFYNPDLYSELQAQTSGEYAGIGILMGTTDDGMYPEIVAVFPDTPAMEAGLEVEDIITEVGGEEVYGFILEQVANRIKGEVGTLVEIQIYRPATDETLDFEIERRQVEFSSITEDNQDVLENGIGVIKISSFAMETGPDFKARLDLLLEQGMEALVIDLRGNTGGLVDAAYDVANLFVKEGLIVEVVGRDSSGEQSRKLYADKGSPKYDIPIVVLQNGASASASEILTGALKDHGLATVVGERSFGKGVVQAVQPLEYHTNGGKDVVKSAVAITIGNYLTPAGTNIHEKGIEPDIWYERANQFEEDAVLAGYEAELEVLREETRQLWKQINDHFRSRDAEQAKALSVAQRLAAGEDVADEPRLEVEEEHNPADSNVLVPDLQVSPVPDREE